MQPQRGPRPFDITTRLLIDTDPGSWLRWIGLPVDGPVQPIDSAVSTVLAEVDKVLRVEAPSPWLAHIELQSSYDHLLPFRLLQYHALLLRRHRLPVESTVVLLRKSADGPEMTGRFVQRGLRGRVTVTFNYEVVRLWESPVTDLLTGGPSLLPLAPMTDLGPSSLSEVIAQMDDHVAPTPSSTFRKEFWATTRILMGLRYDEETIDNALKGLGLGDMRESVIYQAILEEGRAEGREEGREEGRVEGERRIVLRLATNRFGEPSDQIRARIDRITSPDELERLSLRVLTATSWDDLLADAAEE